MITMHCALLGIFLINSLVVSASDTVHSKMFCEYKGGMDVCWFNKCNQSTDGHRVGSSSKEKYSITVVDMTKLDSLNPEDSTIKADPEDVLIFRYVVKHPMKHADVVSYVIADQYEKRREYTEKYLQERKEKLQETQRTSNDKNVEKALKRIDRYLELVNPKSSIKYQHDCPGLIVPKRALLIIENYLDLIR